MQLDFSKKNNFQDFKAETDFEIKVLSFIEEWFSDSKTVQVQTSGSTGAPKVFDIEKSRMLASAQKTCDFLELKERDSALLCLPIEYISGKMMVVRSILRKLKLTVANPSLNPLENLNKKIEFCAMTPLQVENSRDKLQLIQKIIIGGASVSETLKEKIKKKLTTNNQTPATKIYETYGMSETLSHIGLRQVFPNEEECFSLFDGVKIDQDERGCLRIYAPELNSEILQTNDIVEILHFDSAQLDKRQFRFLGRADNVINSGGAKIFPEQLEALVKKEIPNEVVFLGVSDEVLGQKLVLVVEETKAFDFEGRENLKSQISNLKFEKSFHKPKEIVFIVEIPRTPNGKVNRRELLSRIMK